MNNKKAYTDIMEMTLSAYKDEHISKYFSEVKKSGITEHGFPRLTANIGILISLGKRCDLYDIFVEMMDFCCNEFLKPKKPLLGNDFSVKEIIFCIIECEASGKFPKEKTDYWRSLLSQIKAENCYNVYATSTEETPANWALYTAVSEFMRGHIKLADTSEFVDIQIATQLKRLDENYMYRDAPSFDAPYNPIVYDLVSRGLFCVLMHFGYNGKYRKEIDECLKKAGLLTLKMQSVIGELPYGGRSNQFLFNDALMAIIFEYEANRYYQNGDLSLAGKFKNSANAAIGNTIKWLSRDSLTHIRNNYKFDSGFGCEKYAYFDKYMITTASFFYVAYMMSNEEITAVNSPQEKEIFSLSKHFHKTFLKNDNWFVEIDDNADTHYDSNGIGRVHFKGAPSAICLSVPGTATPNYKADILECIDFAIVPGVSAGDEILFALRDNAKYTLKKTDKEILTAEYECSFSNGKTAAFSCTVNDDNIAISVTSDSEVFLMLPAFAFDGQSSCKIIHKDNILEVFYNGYVCRYTSKKEIFDLDKTGFNRNGKYNIFCTKGHKEISVTIEIKSI